MNKHLCFLFLLAVCFTASARQDDLSRDGGISPDKHCTVFVEQADKPGATIYYLIRDRRSGAVLGRLPSTYQSESGDESEFDWDQSHPSWIYWRADSRCVAIDEANHNHMGSVIIALRLKQRFHQVTLNEEALIHKTGQPWDKVRLFFGDNSFLPHARARIDIIGMVRHRGRNYSVEFGCAAILDLRTGKVLHVVFPKSARNPSDR